LPAIHAVDDLDLAGFNCIEHGSGLSTLYYLQRVNQLLSFENDLTTFGTVVSQHIRNYKLNSDNFYYLKDYLNPSAELLSKFLNFFSAPLPLLVAIDGGSRDALVDAWTEIVLSTRSDIVLLIDNSDSPNYRKCFEHFYKAHLHVANYYGPSIVNSSYHYSTSIVARNSSLIANSIKCPFGHSSEIVQLDHQISSRSVLQAV
jgi:hypothetical protein